MKGLFFITDLHVCSVCRSRIDSPIDAIGKKLQWVVSYCNAHDYALVLGGDIFDTPTVSFEVYNWLVSILGGLQTSCYAVWGNHDMLYRSHTNASKCALFTLGNSGVIRFIGEADQLLLDNGSIILTSSLPLQTRSVPQVLVYHGFLEIKDGAFTVSVSDLLGCTSDAVVLLGHDHSVYDDVILSNGVRIVRCGSFYRNRRDAACMRGVYGVEVTLADGALLTKRVLVPSAPYGDVFAEKSCLKASGESDVSYEVLLSTLKSCSTERDLTFDEALRAVASAEEVEYIQKRASHE